MTSRSVINPKTLMLVGTALTLTACGGGSDAPVAPAVPPVSTTPPTVPPPPPPPPVSQAPATLSGHVTAASAACSLSLEDADGNEIASGISMADGSYALKFAPTSAPSSLLTLFATNCSYADETTGTVITGADMSGFAAVPDVVEGAEMTLELTPLTAAIAERVRIGGDLGASALTAEASRMSTRVFGTGTSYDLQILQPFVSTDRGAVAGAAQDATDAGAERRRASRDYGLVLAAISGADSGDADTGGADGLSRMIDMLAADADGVWPTEEARVALGEGAARFELSGRNATDRPAPVVLAALHARDGADTALAAPPQMIPENDTLTLTADEAADLDLPTLFDTPIADARYLVWPLPEGLTHDGGPRLAGNPTSVGQSDLLVTAYGPDGSVGYSRQTLEVVATPDPEPTPPPPPPTTETAGDLVSPAAFDARDYAHLGSLLSDQGRMDADVRSAYADWSARYLKRPSQAYIDANGGQEMLFVTGFDQSFVGRPENGAVSEGVGYGLVIAALMDDREAFDRVWRFAESKLNRHGLMEWLYDNNGYTVDFNGGSGRVNATDGDLDAAYGLLVAAARWEEDSYADNARTLIGNILEHNVTDDNYLTSGDDGYDEANSRATLNRPLVTSYMAPAYFRMFADFTGDARWDDIADQGLQQIRNNQADVRAQGGGAGQDGDGLITFRMFETGKIDFSAGGNIYHSDGARAPWRMATDLAWYGSGQARAFVEDFNGFARRQGIGNIYESYNEKGERIGGWGNTQAGWMSGPLASSMLVSGDAGERSQTWDIVLNSYADGYYSGSCRMLGILTAAGWYTNPVVPD